LTAELSLQCGFGLEAVEVLLNASPSSCEVVHGWTDDEINPGAKEEEEVVVVVEEAEGETNTHDKNDKKGKKGKKGEGKGKKK
jgi:hypothetical protein